MTNKIPKENQDRIIKLYESGLSIGEIKQKIGISKPTISKVLKKNNIKIRKGNYQTLDLDINKINEEYNAGFSTYEIAQKHNCTNETIRKYIKNIRTKSERNKRSEESKDKISKSCTSLWEDQEYIKKQKTGFEKFIKSGDASRIAKENYANSLGKWIKTSEARKLLSEKND